MRRKKEKQQHKKQNKKQKMGKGTEQIFLQRRYVKDQQVHEKMLNITSNREIQIKIKMRCHLMPA